ncbi:MAG: RNase A-like domain-containing protein [Janthinobacterium lividum]
MDDDDELSIALTPIELFAILNGKSISPGELASNSWHEMPGPPRRMDISRFLQPMPAGDSTAQMRAYLARNGGSSESATAPIYAPAGRQNAYSHQSHYSQPNAPECWIPPAAHQISRSTFNRAGAVLEIVGAGMEMTAGVLLILTPEPTMVTKVGGTILTVHSADLMQAAVRQLFSGTSVQDMTQRGTTWVTHEAGASDKTAHRIGVVMDVAVSFTDIGVGLVKLASIRNLRAINAGRIILSEESVAGKAGRVSMDEEEAVKSLGKEGGHTLEKHVNPDRTALEARAARSGKVDAVITRFYSKQLAEDFMNEAIRVNRRAIQRWAKSATSTPVEAFRVRFTEDVGESFHKATGKWVPFREGGG